MNLRDLSRGNLLFMNALVLMSGGIDSTACAHFFQERGDTVTGVFIDYGQVALSAERRAVKLVARHLGIPLSTLEFKSSLDLQDGEVVGRNAFLVFAALMGLQPKAGVISLGIHAGTYYYDCGPDFIDRANEIVQSYSQGRLHLYCPFADEPKASVYRYARFARIPLSLTYSCEQGTVPVCESCLSCKDRNALQTS